MLTWVVGRGGLLGGAVGRAMGPTFIGRPVPWEQHAPAVAVLDADLTRFVRGGR